MIAALLCVTVTIPFFSLAYNNIVWFPNCIHSSCWIRKLSGLLEFLYSRVWYLYLNSAVLNKKLISAGLRSFQLYFWWDCTTAQHTALLSHGIMGTPVANNFLPCCRAALPLVSCLHFLVCYISQLLRYSFSVSQQPQIWEPPSHYSMCWATNLDLG